MTTKRSQLDKAAPVTPSVPEFFSKGGITAAVRLQPDANGNLHEQNAPVYSYADFQRYQQEGWSFRNWLLNGFRYAALKSSDAADPIYLRRLD